MFFSSNGKARRQLMAAEAQQQVGAGLQRGEQVEPAPAAAGALARAAGQVDHKAGTGVFLRQAGGHDAHHPLVPACRRPVPGRCAPGAGSPRSVPRPGSRSPAPRPGAPGSGRTAPGPGAPPGRGLGAQQQIRRHVRRAHAPGGVDAGGQDEADLHGGDGFVGQARLLQQGVEADEVRPADGRQAPATRWCGFRRTSASRRPRCRWRPGCSSGTAGPPPGSRPPRASTSFSATPHAGQVLEGIAGSRAGGGPPRRRPAGSSSLHSWWSVTTTSMPRELA